MSLVTSVSRAASNFRDFAFGRYDKSPLFTAAEERAMAAGGELVREVFEAFRDPQYQFRTVRGIAQELGVLERQIAQIIQSHEELIRMSPAPSRDLHRLFILRSKSSEPSLKELISEWQMFQKGQDFLEPA